MDLGLKDKVAVITGGSVGIGLAIADELAREGVHLVLCARGEERLTNEAKRLRATHGVRVLTVVGDVAQAGDIDRLVEATRSEFGGADILINNAGTGSNETIMEAPDEKWQHYWDLHVMAAVRTARGFAPMMMERGGGVILNNASICAAQPLWYEPIYNVTKAALSMFSKCLADEMIPHNIRVNGVNLGLVLTPDWVKTAKQLTEGTDRTYEDYLQEVADEHATIKRFATPQEAANLFVFLCSDRASYAVGSTFYLDGGMLKALK